MIRVLKASLEREYCISKRWSGRGGGLDSTVKVYKVEKF